MCSFLVIKLIVNCMNGLLNSSIFSLSELMVSGDVERSARCKREINFHGKKNPVTVKKYFFVPRVALSPYLSLVDCTCNDNSFILRNAEKADYQ